MKNRIRVIATFLCLASVCISLTNCESCNKKQNLNGDLNGIVKDAETDTIVPNVRVIISGNNQTSTSLFTDQAGSFNVTLLGGTYTISFEKENYFPHSESVTIDEVSKTFNFYINRFGSIGGKVTDEASNTPIEGATIKLKKSGTPPIILITGQDGEFLFPDVDNGNYVLEITCFGYKDETISINLPDESNNSYWQEIKIERHEVPSAEIVSFSAIGHTNATIEISFIGPGGGINYEATQLILCYSPIKQIPDTTDLTKDLGILYSANVFTDELCGLNSSTTYYCRVLAINQFGFSFSAVMNFTTTTIGDLVVTTVSIGDRTHNSIMCFGEVISSSSSGIIDRGFEYRKTDGGIAEIKSAGSVGIGSFSVKLDNLAASTNYTIRAYVSDYDTTVYSAEIQVSTEMPIPPDMVTTGTPYDIQPFSAKIDGTVNNMGIGISITNHGHCWIPAAAGQEPVYTDENTSFGIVQNVGEYTSNITGLSPATNYYVRAYLEINGTSVIYGEKETFTTNSN